jgi:hypothetical protein
METLLRQLVDEALAAERQKLQEERAQLQREKKALAKERKALRLPGASSPDPEASPPVPAASAASAIPASQAPSVAILPPVWAAERADLLRRIAALEKMVGALSAENKHTGSASSTPCKPRKKKQAGAEDDMDGLDETTPLPTLPKLSPSPKGSPDVRTAMDDDE